MRLESLKSIQNILWDKCWP